MNFEQALRAELVSISGLSSKVFPMQAMEGITAPFVIYQKTNTEYIKTMDGTTGTRMGRYEIDILATTYSDLQSFLVAVKNKLISFEDRSIGTGGPFVQSVIVQNLIELFEDAVKFYRANFEVTFYYEGS
jgi:uncharacterized protein (DUF1684 family)